MKLHRNNAKLILMLALVSAPLLSMAQAGPYCPPSAPIDGGLGLLLAAGVGYGVKKYTKAKKNKAVEK
jgi:hypothetical protein